MKTLLIGDLHMRDKLGYADMVVDARKEEKEKILDTIRLVSKNCNRIIFLGDQLNGRNNSSEVIKEFVAFIESLGKKEIYIIAGNHEKMGDGKSAIDFMREVNKPNWHIVTNEVIKIEEDVFVPYFYKGELGAQDNKEATKTLMSMIPSGNNLFIHHAVSGYSFNNISTNDLNEIVLPKANIAKKFDRIFCGHIHLPSRDLENKVIYTGSVFTNEVNEKEKYIYTLENGNVEEIKLPCRSIVKLENPTIKELKEYSADTIVKTILSKKYDNEELSEIRNELQDGFDGYVLVEEFKTERKIVKFADGDLDLDIKNLLTIFAKERKIDMEKLFAGWDLIK
jgi:DNA repair exonuclease SbcCD nuclease subunit